MADTYFHSVTLDKEKCKGCTNCIKRCPTEAIRVHKGKATIIKERCIDCGECLRACQNHAKKASTDSLDLLNEYKYKVALPAPALYGQFRSARSRNHLLTAIKRLNFDDVFEVALGAEVVSNATREYMKKPNILKPVISSACPAILRLIQVKYPNLIDNLLPLEAPMEVSARLAREEAVKKTGLDPADIGVFFITPCAAKMFTMKSPLRGEVSPVSGVISFQDIFMPLRAELKKVSEDEEEDLARATAFGVRWPNPGGESIALNIHKFLAVDGIHEVIKIFEALENSRKFNDVDFIEALACKGGCLGGPLTVKNTYVAQVIMKSIRDEAKGKFQVKDLPEREVDYHDILWNNELQHIPVLKLDSDMMTAMRKMNEMEQIFETLPGLDCGACGAPSCRALSEDIVRDEAKITDCIFKLREKVRALAGEMLELENMMPPVLDTDDPEDGGNSNEN